MTVPPVARWWPARLRPATSTSAPSKAMTARMALRWPRWGDASLAWAPACDDPLPAPMATLPPNIQASIPAASSLSPMWKKNRVCQKTDNKQETDSDDSRDRKISGEAPALTCQSAEILTARSHEETRRSQPGPDVSLQQSRNSLPDPACAALPWALLPETERDETAVDLGLGEGASLHC